MIQDVKGFVESSALTRLLANLFIFAILMACVFVSTWQIMHNTPINPYVTTIIGSALTYAVTLLGFHFGAVTATGQPVPQVSQPEEKHE